MCMWCVCMTVYDCVCACVRVRVCVRACVCVWWVGGCSVGVWGGVEGACGWGVDGGPHTCTCSAWCMCDHEFCVHAYVYVWCYVDGWVGAFVSGGGEVEWGARWSQG